MSQRLYRRYESPDRHEKYEVFASQTDDGIHTVSGRQESLQKDGSFKIDTHLVRFAPFEKAKVEKWTSFKSQDDYKSHKDWSVEINDDSAVRSWLQFAYEIRHLRRRENNPETTSVVQHIIKFCEDCYEEYGLESKK